jgi:hypothetical protein
MMKMNFELNNFVIKMAVMNPELVESTFLISYINKFLNIYKSELKLSFKQQTSVFSLLEQKMANPDALIGYKGKSIQELIAVIRTFTKQIPVTTDAAITKFLERGQFELNYDTI